MRSIRNLIWFYNMSINNTLQPITPINSDNGWFALGFGADLTPSMALRVFDAAEVGIDEPSPQTSGVFPNPASNHITVDFKEDAATANLTITDMAGRIILTKKCRSCSF